MAAAAAAPTANEIAVRNDYNKLINTMDPPKDARIGNHLTNATHGAAIRNYLYQLFGANQQFLDAIISQNFQLQGVGDQKTELKKSIESIYRLYFEDYTKQLQISRNKSPSGHSQLPAGYNLVQDTMTADCISNPHFIITIGSLLDPGSRQKEVTEAERIQGMRLTEVLDRATFEISQESALSSVLTGAVTCVTDPADRNYWQVTIPTNLGPGGRNENIVIGFRKTGGVVHHPKYNPETGDSDLVIGNNEKNREIAALLNKAGGPTAEDNIRIKKLILLKELGDTIQALILNDLFRTGPYRREDTVVGTCDSVVQYRCIVNGLGVIISENNNAKFTFYMPNVADAFAQALINKRTIQKIIDDLTGENTKVIRNIELVILDATNKIAAASRPSILWIGGSTWLVGNAGNAINYLERYIQKLININNDLVSRLKIMSDITAVKRIAGESVFNPHFVRKTDGYWHAVTSTRSLFKNGSYKFRVALFVNSLFGSPALDEIPKLQRGGQTILERVAALPQQSRALGERILGRRARGRMANRVIPVALITCISSIIYRILISHGVIIPIENIEVFSRIIAFSPEYLIPYIRYIIQYAPAVVVVVDPLGIIDRIVNIVREIMNSELMHTITEVTSIDIGVAEVEGSLRNLSIFLENISEYLRMGRYCNPVALRQWNTDTTGQRSLSRERYEIANYINDRANDGRISQINRDLLAGYRDALLEIEGCRNQLDADRNYKELVEHYSDSIAYKSIGLSLIAARLEAGTLSDPIPRYTAAALRSAGYAPTVHAVDVRRSLRFAQAAAAREAAAAAAAAAAAVPPVQAAPAPAARPVRQRQPVQRYGQGGGGVELDMILANTDNKIDAPGFLFAYVRRMFPELFTYGLHMKIGLAPFMSDVPGLTNHYDILDALKSMNKYLANEDDFEFDKDGLFVLATSIDSELAETLYNATLELVKYSELFTSVYPQVKHEKADALYMYLKSQDVAPFSIPDESLLSTASTIAMDTYSFSYSLEVLSNYHNKKTTDSYIFERLQNIQYYEELLESDPENLVFVYELDYFYDELANVDSVLDLSNEIEKYKSKNKLTYAPTKAERNALAPEGLESVKTALVFGGRRRNHKTRRAKKSKKRQTRRKR